MQNYSSLCLSITANTKTNKTITWIKFSKKIMEISKKVHIIICKAQQMLHTLLEDQRIISMLKTIILKTIFIKKYGIMKMRYLGIHKELIASCCLVNISKQKYKTKNTFWLLFIFILFYSSCLCLSPSLSR